MKNFKWLRVLIATLAVILILDLAWFFGTRNYLRSEAFLKLVNTPELQFDAKDGYSPWPGYFIFHSFVFTGFGETATYQIKADSIAFHLNPFLLFWNKVVIRALTIQDVTVNIGDGPSSEVVIAKKEAQVKAEEEKLTKDNEGVKPYWTISFAHAVMQNVKEFRVHDWAFHGDAKIKASFWLDTDGFFVLEDSKAEIKKVEVLEKKKKLGTLESAIIDSSIAKFSLEDEENTSILKKVDTHWQLQGQLDRVDTIGSYLKQLKWLELSGSALKVKGDVAIKESEWQGGSELKFATDALHVKILEQTIDGNGNFLWQIQKDDKKLNHIELNFGKYTLNKGRDGEGEGFKLTLDTPDKGVLQKWDVWRSDIVLPPTRIHRIQFLQAYIPSSLPLKLEKGRGEIKGEFHASSDSKNTGGFLDVDVKEMSIDYKKLITFAGSAKSRTDITRLDIERGVVDIKDTGIDIKDLSFADKKGWAGSVHMRNAQVKIEKPVYLKSAIEVKGDNLQPVLAFIIKDKNFPEWALKSFDLKQPKVNFLVDATETKLNIRDFKAKSEDLAIEGWFAGETAKSQGKFLFTYGKISGAYGWTGDDSEWKMFGAKDWYQKDLNVAR